MTDIENPNIKLNEKDTKSIDTKEQNVEPSEKENEKQMGEDANKERNETKGEGEENITEEGKQATETEGERGEKEMSEKENETEKKEEEKEDEDKPLERQGSTFGRFLSWWRGKPKTDDETSSKGQNEKNEKNEVEDDKKEEREKNEREQDDSKEKTTEVENSTKEKSETMSSNSLNEKKDEHDKFEEGNETNEKKEKGQDKSNEIETEVGNATTEKNQKETSVNKMKENEMNENGMEVDENKQKNEMNEVKDENSQEKEKENIQTTSVNDKISKITNSDSQPENGPSDGVFTLNVKNTAKLSSITDRHLEKILEERKDVGKTAPLAQPEEDTDSSDTRIAIDSGFTASQIHEADTKPGKSVEVRTNDKVSDQVSNTVEKFVVIRDYSEDISKKTEVVIDSGSEVEEVSKVSCRVTTTGQYTQPFGKHCKTQSNKMEVEDVIEEQHHDIRRQNVSETWRRIDPGAESPKETGNKSFRISYTIRTETIETSNNDDKSNDDDGILDKDFLVNSAPTRTYEGPPPEDLEPEIVEEHAREEESAGIDIDKFFEQCKEEGTAPLAKEETEITLTEDKNTTSTSPDDIFKILHGWDDEPTDWWTITKKKKEYEEWMKPMKQGTIRRVIIPNVPIPYKTSVAFITDWKCREEWDKTFSEIQVIQSGKSSKTIYCPVKKRDLTFETIEQEEADPPCYILSWKKQETVKDDKNTDTPSRKNQREIQLITHTCGIILRPAESGDDATKITILAQLEGEVDKVLKNTFLTGHPKTWLRNLKKYYKKHQNGNNKKVVYL